MSFLDILGKKQQEEALPITPVLPKDIYAQGKLDLVDTIAPAALKISAREVELGEKFARTFYTISYPAFLSDGWFTPIINLDQVLDVAIFIHPIDTESVLHDFQKKVAEVQSQINERESKGLVRDPKLDTAYQNLEELRDRLQQAREKLFDVGLYLTLYGDSKEAIDKIEGDIRGILDSQLVYTKPALFQQEQGFRTTLPLGNDELQVESKLNSEPLSSIFPFVSFDLTSDRGILYGINRHNASLILFDRFSLENYNSVVFAKSGSGKSLRYDEPVLVREGGHVRLEKIGPLVERTIKRLGCISVDDDLEGAIDPGIEVFSFDKNLKGRWSAVSVAARKDAPDAYYTFKTKSGRTITTTADHNMLVLREGRVVTAKSADIAVGENVPLPRRVSGPTEPTRALNLLSLPAFAKNPRIYVLGAEEIARAYRRARKARTAAPVDARLDPYLYHYEAGRRMPIGYLLGLLAQLGIAPDDTLAHSLTLTTASGKSRLPALLPLSEALGTLLGYLSSEGTVTDRAAIVTNTDAEVVADIERAFGTLGVGHYRVDRAVASGDVPCITLARALGVHGYSATKSVPGTLFSAPTETVAAYLRAYFEGDGGIDGAAITAVSKSRELLSGIAYLLYYFGIVARVHKREKRYAVTGRKRTFWQLSISGQEYLRAFEAHIGFVSARKKAALASLAKETANTNVDSIPGLAPLADELADVFGSQLGNMPEFSALRQGHNFSPKRLARLTDALEARVQRFRNMRPLMETLADLPTIESIVAKAAENRELNRRLIEALGSSWFTVKQGMPPRAENALAICAAAGIDAPSDVSTLKTIVADGLRSMGLPANGFAPHLSMSLRGERDNSSYELLRSTSAFITDAYERAAAALPRIEAIIRMFRNLANADLLWDPIVSIEKTPNRRDRYVYDLTVDDEVFLAGENGMFVHNSYATKLEILRSLMFGTDVIVIDPEREYEQLAAATDGRSFNISLSSEHHINPFDLPAVQEGEDPRDLLRNNIITLVGLFRIMLGGLTPEEDALIDRAVTETYALKDITGDSDFSNIEPPVLSDFEAVLTGMEGSDSLVERLAKYTSGSWSGFINQATNIDINRQFVVFSVRDMEDELKPVAMYIISHYIWNAIRRNLKKRLLIIDEAWWMMKSEDTASFLYSLAKRGRKYYLGVCTITQDVEDFLRSPYGRPILTNSSIQLLLKQSPTTVDVLQKTFNLTDEEKYLLLESGVGEGLFFAGLKHVAIKIVASYTEDQIITSDPSQLLAIKQEKERLEAHEQGL